MPYRSVGVAEMLRLNGLKGPMEGIDGNDTIHLIYHFFDGLHPSLTYPVLSGLLMTCLKKGSTGGFACTADLFRSILASDNLP